MSNKIDTEPDKRQTNRWKRESMFSYSRGHEASKKYKSRESPDVLDYNTSLAYVWEITSFVIKAKNDEDNSATKETHTPPRYDACGFKYVRR